MLRLVDSLAGEDISVTDAFQFDVGMATAALGTSLPGFVVMPVSGLSTGASRGFASELTRAIS